MNSEQMRKSWNGMSEEIMSGIAEWRQQHPDATLSEDWWAMIEAFAILLLALGLGVLGAGGRFCARHALQHAAGPGGGLDSLLRN